MPTPRLRSPPNSPAGRLLRSAETAGTLSKEQHSEILSLGVSDLEGHSGTFVDSCTTEARQAYLISMAARNSQT